ncbi:MAG: aldehyde dehydrogenase (NADP(+)) [Spirochaetaceae bacterium]|nr:MAG: aldehyde dehydrogenase (NADP(+)) [Spirochaetaceae bacterium]
MSTNQRTDTIYGVNPKTGERLDPGFPAADAARVDALVADAVASFARYRATSGPDRAAFLRAIASQIEALGDELITVCDAETALGPVRIASERGRTVNQLRMFADLVEEGSWVDARIDTAMPDRSPLPKPDIRRMLAPIGPVVVFGASNFPLAFSVAGGDTASALAAGNPVIVKAHGSHPGTSALVGKAVSAAAQQCGLPTGVFAVVHGPGSVVGSALVKHPGIRAVGFTGSRGGGRALMDLAAARETPIPVYAEMGSINPLIVLPHAIAHRGTAIAEGLAGSVCLGVGQFCTNPGLILVVEPAGGDAGAVGGANAGGDAGAGAGATAAFVSRLAATMEAQGPGVMLNRSIASTYCGMVARFASAHGVVTHTGAGSQEAGGGASSQPDDTGTTQAAEAGPDGHATVPPALFSVSADVFVQSPLLAEEVFGPATLVVRCADATDVTRCLSVIGGNLTATLHGDDEDFAGYADLVRVVEQTVGRVIFNGFPTGVEVCPSMTHGGPYPASASEFHTSVGTGAILRFARPVSYQNCPQSLLPAELQNANPRGIMRIVNGAYTRDPVV